MLNKLTNYSNYVERQKFIKEAESMIKKYGWEEKTVHPWSYPIKVTSIIDDLKDYDLCTTGSKHQIISLVNGLADILNAWEKYELAPKKKIIANGKVKEVECNLAEELVKEGLAEWVAD